MSNTIVVTVGPKPADHPFYGRGSKHCFYLNGAPGLDLELVVGTQYTFDINTPGHPFYFTSSESGGFEDKQVLGNFAPSDKGTVTFLVPDSLPDRFYYQCRIHFYMGGFALKKSIKAKHNTFYVNPILKGLVGPTSLSAPKNSSSIYVADQIGLVYKYDLNTRQSSIFLDVREYIPKLNDDYEERGLLGLCFHPEFNQNGRVFIFYSSTSERQEATAYNTNVNYYNCLSEFTFKDGKILYEAEKVLIRIPRDLNYHNGGKIDFGPDGYLYITIGDAGPQRDVNNNAQDLAKLFGKILRIDVNGIDTYPYYRIPSDNPFVNVQGVRSEIWAYGFRNPWGLEFYQNVLVVTDAGYESGSGQEEVNVVYKGGNYGWNIKEGRNLTPWTKLTNPQILTTLMDPIFAYTTSDRNFADSDVSSIIGGYFDKSGDYICADYSGKLIRLRFNPQGVTVVETASLGKWIRSFGKVGDQLYVLTSEKSGPSGTTGEVIALTVV